MTLDTILSETQIYKFYMQRALELALAQTIEEVLDLVVGLDDPDE